MTAGDGVAARGSVRRGIAKAVVPGSLVLVAEFMIAVVNFPHFFIVLYVAACAQFASFVWAYRSQAASGQEKTAIGVVTGAGLTVLLDIAFVAWWVNLVNAMNKHGWT